MAPAATANDPDSARRAVLGGGVDCASQLFDDLIEHWERRSAEALERMHPGKLDRAKLMSLVEKYGYDCRTRRLGGRGARSYPHPHCRGPQPGPEARAAHGRPPKLTDAQQAEARRRRAEGATLAELARSYGVGKSTISRL
jgi:hypothetical protein